MSSRGAWGGRDLEGEYPAAWSHLHKESFTDRDGWHAQHFFTPATVR
jgi:hypothetical protein